MVAPQDCKCLSFDVSKVCLLYCRAMDDFFELKLEFRSCWHTVDYHSDAVIGACSGSSSVGAGSSLKSPGRPSSTGSDYRSPGRVGSNSATHTPGSLSLIHGSSSSNINAPGAAGGAGGAGDSVHRDNGLITPGPRFCHVGVVYDDSLYIFGGYDGVQR